MLSGYYNYTVINNDFELIITLSIEIGFSIKTFRKTKSSSKMSYFAYFERFVSLYTRRYIITIFILILST
jgi:hypothetical protein